MKFLIVDDSKLSRTKLSQILQDLGHTIIGEAQNGLEAIEKFSALAPDCITMDLEMPLLSGIEAAEKFFKINKNVVIVLVTSVMDKRDTLRATQIGIQHILHKPITIDALSSTLHAIIKEESFQ